jgi:hypothetical protein
MAADGKYWTLDDIPWERIQADRVDPVMLRLVKAASLVEFNGGDYARYLRGVFAGDEEFERAADRWAEEEIQHGQALARWAQTVDPRYDFEIATRRFSRKIKLPEGVDRSVRGSRTAELVARCMVEVGTSSYYSALRDAAAEPVLRDICRRIAQDEIRHYKLFFRHMERYEAVEGLGRLRRLRVLLGRLMEAEDDELAYAYYAANAGEEVAYDRKTYSRAYSADAVAFYRPEHVRRATKMMFRAAGLDPNGRLGDFAARGLWVALRVRYH